MSYDIQLNIPEDSQRGHMIASLVADQQITPSQAVEKLIDWVVAKQFTGTRSPNRRIPGLPREPMDDADAALVDEAMDFVMQARRERSQRLLGA